MNETMKPTAAVLRELAVPYWTLYSAVRAGYIPMPRLKVGVSFVWTPDEVAAAKRYFADRKGVGSGQ